jgi:hypothetical protein
MSGPKASSSARALARRRVRPETPSVRQSASSRYVIGQVFESTRIIAKLYNPAPSYDGVKDFALISSVVGVLAT